MPSKGTYVLSNGSQTISSSFKSFICALLVFLSICLIISLGLFLVTYLVKTNNKNELEGDVEVMHLNTDENNEQLVLIEVPESPLTTSTTSRKPSTRTSSAATHKSHDNDDEYEEEEYDNDIVPSRANQATTRLTTILRTTTLNNIGVDETTEKTANSVPNIIDSDSTSTSTSTSTEIRNKVDAFLSTDLSSTTSNVTLDETTEKTANSVPNITSIIDSDSTPTSTEIRNKVDAILSTDLSSTTSNVTLTEATTKTENLVPHTASIAKLGSTSSSTIPSTTISNKIDTDDTSSSTVLSSTTTSSVTPSTTAVLKTNEAIPKITQITTPDSQKYCSKVSCSKISTQMLAQMQHVVNPCDDFYEFSCGGYENFMQYGYINKILEYFVEIDHNAEEFISIFKQFYDSCVTYEDSFDYDDRFKHVLSQSTTTNDTTEAIAKSILGDYNPLFDVGIDVDGSSHYVLELTLPGHSSLRNSIKDWSVLNLAKKKCLKKAKKLEKNYIVIENLYDSYSKCVHDKYVEIIKGDQLKFRMPYCRSLSNLDWFSKIVANSPREQNIREAHILNDYTEYTISQLKMKFGNIEWLKLFQIITGKSVEETMRVRVYFEEELSSRFKAVNAFGDNFYLNMHLFNYVNFYENTVIPQDTENREKYCVDLAHNLMPDIVTYIHKKTYSDEKLHNQNIKLVILFNSLKKEFQKSLKESEFLDETVKSFLMGKLKVLKHALFSIADVNILENELKQSYSKISLVGNFQDDLFTLMNHYRKSIYFLAETTATESELFSYFVDVFDTVPKVFFAMNTVAIPYGIYDRTPVDVPNYILMGRVGFSLAREIVRSINLYFDEDREVPRINLPETTNSTYNNLKDSTIRSLDEDNFRTLNKKNITFKMLSSGVGVDKLIAEISAFQLVTDALNEIENDEKLPWISMTYSKEQLFFIAAAQEYCEKFSIQDLMLSLHEKEDLPGTLKVKQIMNNSEKFSKVFQCIPGTAMNINPDGRLVFPSLQYEELLK